MFLLRKVKSLILWVLRMVRRAFCCFRVRRNPDEIDDTNECLTHIEIDSNRSQQDGWAAAWGENKDTPRTVEEHIQSYREKLSAAQPADPNKRELENLFQELEPQDIKQKRVVIATDKTTQENTDKADLSRLSAINNFSSELGEWMDESSGWDEQQLDPTDIIRQQKRHSHSRNKLQTTKLAA